jgi:hypothetical protein
VRDALRIDCEDIIDVDGSERKILGLGDEDEHETLEIVWPL